MWQCLCGTPTCADHDSRPASACVVVRPAAAWCCWLLLLLAPGAACCCCCLVLPPGLADEAQLWLDTCRTHPHLRAYLGAVGPQHCLPAAATDLQAWQLEGLRHLLALSAASRGFKQGPAAAATGSAARSAAVQAGGSTDKSEAAAAAREDAEAAAAAAAGRHKTRVSAGMASEAEQHEGWLQDYTHMQEVRRAGGAGFCALDWGTCGAL